MTSVNGISNVGNVFSPELNVQKENGIYKIPKSKPDEYTTKSKEDKSTNGKFDKSECLKNFAKGCIEPLKAIVDHPVATALTVATTVAACTLVPVLGPVLAVGFTALSLYQGGKGAYEAYQHYQNGEYDKAEQSFNKIGEGFVGTLLSRFGLKQSAQVAKEAKVMSELNVNTLNPAKKTEIGKEVTKMSSLQELKEVGSLFTSKDGLTSIVKQFKPSAIKQRATDIYNHLFTKVDKVKTEKAKFSETVEGKRRAALSTEEINKEVQALAKESFDEYGIPEGLRPEVNVYKGKMFQGGGYQSSQHLIIINENAYRKGAFDLPNVIKHEATHAKEAILRQQLPQEEKQQIIVDYLLDKINNGDKENVLVDVSFIGNLTMKPPKLNAQMKTDFAKLAQDKLYQNNQYTNDELTAMVKPLVENNPEFIQQYKNVDEAVKVMTNYAKSHNIRYRAGLNNATGFNTSKVDASLLKELTEEEKIIARQSVKDGIDCIESNATAGGGIFGVGGDFNQYQFTPEEVLAQQKGNSFEISKLESQLTKLREKPNYDIAEEARLLDQIKFHELTLEYKTKGKEMYKLYTESINHPENKELAAKVKELQSELNEIQKQINSITQGKQNGKEIYIEANDYKIYQARPDLGTSVNIPYSTPVATNIFIDKINDKAS